MKAEEMLAQVDWSKFREADNAFKRLDARLGTLSRMHPFIEKSMVKRALSLADELEEKARRIEQESPLEKAYVQDLLGKADYARKWLSLYYDTSAPRMVIRAKGYGADEKTVARVKEFVVKNYKRVSDRTVEFSAYGTRAPRSPKEKEEAKDMAVSILRKIFEEYNPKQSPWRNWKDYLRDWIVFSDGTGTFCDTITGVVFLKYKHLRMLVDWQRERVFKDPCNAGLLVGEEALAGHQGHWLRKKEAGLPYFLRAPIVATKAHSETIGVLGALKGMLIASEDADRETVDYNWHDLVMTLLDRDRTLALDWVLETEGVERAVSLAQEVYPCSWHESDEFKRSLRHARLERDYNPEKWAYSIAAHTVLEHKLYNLSPWAVRLLQTGELSVRGMNALISLLENTPGAFAKNFSLPESIKQLL